MNKIPKKNNLKEIAQLIRGNLAPQNKTKGVLLFAYNGVGKTRLSMEFKNLGKHGDSRDTLYYNAFTEDLFTWYNDLDNDNERYLIINTNSNFFTGFKELAMEERIREFYNRYADLTFVINYEDWTIHFSKKITNEPSFQFDQTSFDDVPFTAVLENIKVSRGEETIFIWCVFLAICRLTLEKDPAYSWVKYIYIDDPISSLDENNAIMVAVDLAKLLNASETDIKFLISSHHSLFFNIMCHELKGKVNKHFLSYQKSENLYSIPSTGDTPFFHHVAMVAELQKAINTNKIYTYHFNILRTLLEKSANFHGFKDFSQCLDIGQNEEEIALHTRYVNLLSHGNYTMYDAIEMLDDNKEHFRNMFQNFMKKYTFNPEIFELENTQEENTQ